jgi:DNA-binding transcriptional LysR family regulator
VDLRDLEAFVAVAEELHFGRAAARLQMAQPPLSSRIGHLERELKLQLFQRSTRSVTLTDAGSRLLGPARRVLAQMTAVSDTAAAIASGDEGRIRIGFAGASSQRALPLLASAVRKAHPGIQLVLQSQTYVFTAFKLLVSGDLDVAFVRLPVMDAELSHRVVEVERLICAMPAGHRLADRDIVDMQDLVDEDFISLADDQGSILQATMVAKCMAAGFAPRIVQIAPDSATVLALVAAGAGVTVTLSSVCQVQSVGIVYRPVAGPGPDYLLLALGWRTDNPSPALRRVLAVSEVALPTPDFAGLNVQRSTPRVGRS